MKYIQLSKQMVTSPYDMIIHFGCGPNFVLNRSKRFESMLKQQGAKFWFRFWLIFCLNPGCHDQTAVQELWPEMTCYVYLRLHEIFLQGSIKRVTRYCLNEVIKLMLTKEPDSKESTEMNSQGSSIDKMQDIVIRCTIMAFGIALCTMFFKWTKAEEIDEASESYWTIPEEYLNPKFKPGLLEEFLVAQWKDKLYSLLGVEDDEIAWIKRLIAGDSSHKLHTGIEKINKNVCRHDSYQFICRMSEFMNRNRNRKKFAIRKVDDFPMEKTNHYLALNHLKNIKQRPANSEEKVQNQEIKEKNNSRIISWSASSPLTTENSELSDSNQKKYRQCSYCWSTEKKSKKFKKCKRCVDENWLVPRYYCNQICQVADWKELHHEEHIQFRSRYDAIPKPSTSCNKKKWKEENNLPLPEKQAIISKDHELIQFTLTPNKK